MRAIERRFDSSSRRAARLIAYAGLLAALGGCNLITGASDLTIDGDGVGGSGGSFGSGIPSTGPGIPTGTGSHSTGSGNTSCSPPCGAGQTCDEAAHTCKCADGATGQGALCFPQDPGDPADHSQADVCAMWKQGHVVASQSPLKASGEQCDPGTLEDAAISDTLVRIDLFRWLGGLGPVSEDPSMRKTAQECANLESFYDWSNPGSPHSPPSNTPCYTAEGGGMAGQSNLAWGSGHPAQAIDQYMQDNGNETTMGHRRWIMNPPLGPVAIGYWEGGGMYGNAQCLRVFGMSGNGPNPPWTSMPPPGYAPVEITQWTWTFQGNLGGIPNAQISMVDVDADKTLAVKVINLNQGYAQDTISWVPSGWQPQAGKTYRVKVSGLAGGDVTYDVKPVSCN